MRDNILITGGAGFIGSNLAEELVKENNVIAIDNFITSDVANIEDLLRNPHFEFLNHDLIKPIDLSTFKELSKFNLKTQGISAIYHLACPTSPKDYDRIPIETALTNAYGARNVLDLALKYQAVYVLGSTGFIYGAVPPEKQPVAEDYFGLIDPIGPRSCYNEGKRFAECLSVIYQNKYKIPVKIARIFNSYGSKMRLLDGRIIPDFVYSAIQNRPLVIYGGQNATDTFCYISDLTAGLIKLARSPETGVFNLGHPTLYYLKEAAEAIIKIVGSESMIEYSSAFPYQEEPCAPDISKAEKKLNWMPVVSLEQGLIKTVETLRASNVVRLKEGL